VICGGTVLRKAATIEEHALVGKPERGYAVGHLYPGAGAGTVIGAGVVIRTGAVVYAGCTNSAPSTPSSPTAGPATHRRLRELVTELEELSLAMPMFPATYPARTTRRPVPWTTPLPAKKAPRRPARQAPPRSPHGGMLAAPQPDCANAVVKSPRSEA
jgi:hypothetical protein